MPLPTKPTNHTEFDLNQTNTNQPTGSLVTDGYTFGDAPSSQNFNWILNNSYLWEEYFDDLLDILLAIVVLDDANNRLGVGDFTGSDVESLFHVKGADIQGAATADATKDHIVTDGTTESYVNIRSNEGGSQSIGGVIFSDGTRDIGSVKYRHNQNNYESNTLELKTNSTTALTVHDDQKVVVNYESALTANQQPEHALSVIGAQKGLFVGNEFVMDNSNALAHIQGGNIGNHITDFTDDMLKLAAKSGTTDVVCATIKTNYNAQVATLDGTVRDLYSVSSQVSSFHGCIDFNSGNRGFNIRLATSEGSITDSHTVSDFTNVVDIRRDANGGVGFGAKIKPLTDNTYDIGTSGLRWQDIYATNGTIQTSDRNLKRDIIDLPVGLSFLNKLRPVSYRFVDTEEVTHTRRHYGLIAQEVEQLLDDEGISTSDFAALVKDSETDRYAMRYTELLPLCIKAIQEQSEQITALEARVTALENG